jgi:glycerol kinase
MFNIHRGDWDDELLGVLNIPRAVLPRIVPSSGRIAETARTLFGAIIPIAGVAGDQQAALFGQRCTTPGMVKNTYGTGCFMLMQTGGRAVASRNKLLTTTAWRIGGHDDFALEGSVFIAGAVVQWLRDGLGIIKTAAEVGVLAATVNDNGGVYFVPAFAGLGTPHWDPYARGTIVGLTRGTNAGHIARAALESIAFQVADMLQAMQADAAIGLSELRVDGGATQNDFLMQFQADLLGVRVVRPKIFETTALGAAYLAGLGVGFWKDAAEIDTQWQAGRVFEPAMERSVADGLSAQWRRALTRAADWAAHE